jgi:hypothetical protein
MKACGMLEPLPHQLRPEFYAFRRLKFRREQARRLPRSLKDWLSEQTFEIEASSAHVFPILRQDSLGHRRYSVRQKEMDGRAIKRGL